MQLENDLMPMSDYGAYWNSANSEGWKTINALFLKHSSVSIHIQTTMF